MMTITKTVSVSENKYPTIKELEEILNQMQSGEVDLDEVLIENPKNHFEYFEIESLFGDGFRVRAMKFKNGINTEQNFEYIESVLKLYKKFLQD